jgi:hypothetical protein
MPFHFDIDSETIQPGRELPMQKNPVNTPQVSTGFERIEGVRTASLPIDLMVNAATEKQNIGIGYRDSVDA